MLTHDPDQRPESIEKEILTHSWMTSWEPDLMPGQDGYLEHCIYKFFNEMKFHKKPMFEKESLWIYKAVQDLDKQDQKRLDASSKEAKTAGELLFEPLDFDEFEENRRALRSTAANSPVLSQIE